jgi:hypothetical protein
MTLMVLVAALHGRRNPVAGNGRQSLWLFVCVPRVSWAINSDSDYGHDQEWEKHNLIQSASQFKRASRYVPFGSILDDQPCPQCYSVAGR